MHKLTPPAESIKYRRTDMINYGKQFLINFGKKKKEKYFKKISHAFSRQLSHYVYSYLIIHAKPIKLQQLIFTLNIIFT